MIFFQLFIGATSTTTHQVNKRTNCGETMDIIAEIQHIFADHKNLLRDRLGIIDLPRNRAAAAAAAAAAFRSQDDKLICDKTTAIVRRRRRSW